MGYRPANGQMLHLQHKEEHGRMGSQIVRARGLGRMLRTVHSRHKRSQADIALVILLPQPPHCTDYRCGTPCLASTIFFSQMMNDLVVFFFVGLHN